MFEKKEIGKIFLTDLGEGDKCECGKEIEINAYILWPLNKTIKEVNPEKKIRIGFCECGNVFVRQYLHSDYIKWGENLWKLYNKINQESR